MHGVNLQRRSILAAALGAACILMPTSAFAHRKKHAISTVEWNEKTKLLEVTHVLHLHDAEQALARLGKLNTPDLTPLRSRARLALYAQKNFKLTDLNGEALALNIIGAEIDAGQAFVYLEIALTKAPDGLRISDTLLQDIYLEQTNLVNVRLGKDIHSLTFFSGDREKKVLA